MLDILFRPRYIHEFLHFDQPVPSFVPQIEFGDCSSPAISRSIIVQYFIPRVQLLQPWDIHIFWARKRYPVSRSLGWALWLWYAYCEEWTHCARMTHLHIIKWSHYRFRLWVVACFRRRYIISPNAGLLLIGPLRTNFSEIFSCDQAALWMVFSVCPSVCLSVCLSVCPSHLFDYVPIIVSSWNFQELSPRTRVTSMQKVKVRGQRSRSQRSQPNLAVSGL